MPPGFARLPFLGRRSTHGEPSPGDASAVRPPIDLDLTPVGPPVLLPSAIFRQVLFEATELVPTWALPRAGLAQMTTPNEPKATKRPRQSTATRTSPAKPATAAPRRRTSKRDV
jgi:hypothetical protein